MSHDDHECPGVLDLWGRWKWNRRLLDGALGTDVLTNAETSRIVATPAWLAEIVGHPQQSEDVVACFSAAHTEVLDGTGSTLVTASLELVRKAGWSAASSDPPPFFSLLWASCLVAWGYPDLDKDFRGRLRQMMRRDVVDPLAPSARSRDLATASDCLDLHGSRVDVRDLWEVLAGWTARSKEHATLVLPDVGGHDVLVGTSYKLVAPDLHDRRWLAWALTESDLVGYEPPQRDAVDTLLFLAERGSRRPQAAFVTELRRLRTILEAGSHLTSDPVWIGIVTEALDPSDESSGLPPLKASQLALRWDGSSGVWDGWILSETTVPPLVAGAEWRPDRDVVRQGFVLRYLDDQHGWSTAWRAVETDALDHTLLGRLLRQGVVCLQLGTEGMYRAVSSPSADSTVALVRSDLVTPFVESFGGRATVSDAANWSVVDSCEIRTFTAGLPEGLEAVNQLRRTTLPPYVRLVGGLQLSSGRYLRAEGLEPSLRAPDAESVNFLTGGRRVLCERDPETEDFILPPGTSEDGHFEVQWRQVEWAVRLVPLRWDDSAIGRPKEVEGDFWISGPEGLVDYAPADSTAGHLIAPGGGQLVDLADLHPTRRELGAVLGDVGDAVQDPIAVAYGRRGRPQALVQIASENPECRPAVRDANLRQWWRDDVLRAAVPLEANNASWHRGSQAIVPLRQAARTIRGAGRVEATGDHNYARIRLDAAYHGMRIPRRHANQFFAAVGAASARRQIGLKDWIEYWDQLGRFESEDAAYELLRGYQYSGRIEVLVHHVSGARRIRGVPPTLLWSRVGPKSGALLEATLTGLTNLEAAARLFEHLSKFADVRWRASTWIRAGELATAWVPPVLTVLTDSPRAVEEAVKSEVGTVERRKAPDVPTVPSIETVSASTPPAGYVERHRYHLDEDQGLAAATCHDSCDNVHVSRRTGRHHLEVYVVTRQRDVLYWSPWRDWAALRASEIGGVPAFRLCKHGSMSSLWPRFASLPTALARPCTLTYGTTQPSVRFGTDGRVEGIDYHWGRGAALLKSRWPAAWLREDLTCTIH
jgi:hypothetical protein